MTAGPLIRVEAAKLAELEAVIERGGGTDAVVALAAALHADDLTLNNFTRDDLERIRDRWSA